MSCISKVEKERLSLTTPASGMKALAQIGAWHNSLDRMPAVILVSPLLNYFFITEKLAKAIKKMKNLSNPTSES